MIIWPNCSYKRFVKSQLKIDWLYSWTWKYIYNAKSRTSIFSVPMRKDQLYKFPRKHKPYGNTNSVMKAIGLKKSDAAKS